MAVYRNAFCIIQLSQSRHTNASMRYMKWILDTIMRIPVSVFDNIDEIPELIDENHCYRFNGIIILPGEIRKSETLHGWLKGASQKIPILLFFDSLDDETMESIFGISRLYSMKGHLDEICLKGDLSNAQGSSGKPLVNDLDGFVVAKQVESASILATVNGRPFIMRNGMNYFVGQLGIFHPKANRFLEYDRPAYYLHLLNSILQNWAVAIIRAKLAYTPICIRIDDPPGNTVMMKAHVPVMKAKEYRNLIWIAEKKGIKIDCAVVAAFDDVKRGVIPWYDTCFSEQKDVLRVLKNGCEKGIIEVSCHGLTHMRPNLIQLNPLLDLIRFRWKMNEVSREFYDEKNRRAISYGVQKHRIKMSLDILKKEFDTRVSVFVPPTHAFDSSTEKILSEHNIPYLSADMNFYDYPEGGLFRKNPCAIGTSSENGDVMYISATILGPFGSFGSTIQCFDEIGIPIIWARHIYPGENITFQDVFRFAKLIEPLNNYKYLSLKQAGDLLKKYTSIQMDGFVSEEEAFGNISSELECEVGTLYRGKYHGVRFFPGQSKFNLRYNDATE